MVHSDWQFRDGTSRVWHEAQVPGTVQEDLLRLGLLPDPFFATNEDSLTWVEEKNWIYKTNFSVPTAQLKHTDHKLVFHGLDTYAEVYLNGQQLLYANNMFRTWEVDVSRHLKENNELKIVFFSPILAGKTYMDGLPYTLPADNDAGDIKVMPVVRKAAFHFGWDWGPRIVTSGIWRPAELLSWTDLRVTDFHIEDEIDFLDDNAAIVSAVVEIEGQGQADLAYWVEGAQAETQLVKPGKQRLQFKIDKAERWWPSGQGAQPLYPLHIQLGDNQLTKKIGLRTAELIHEPDSLGTAFYFKINGRPIFAKGANYIPQRHLTNSLTKADYRKVLTTAVESNMNMIRVWGGGIYEEDYFYELCDSLGLMVWQDFMFANTIFPAQQAFMDNMLAEVRDNLNRLGHHPSIVHWCGNNEINVAWHNWGWQNTYSIIKKHQKQLYTNYNRIFLDSLPRIVKERYPLANYTHTSPISNWNASENFDHSSMHYWGVFHGEDPFEDYGKNIGRFNSEYGFQTFPNINVVKDYFMPAKFDLKDPLLDHRQKSYKGNRLIYKHIDDYYPEPTSLLELSYLSQLTQAKGIKMAITSHRLDYPRCMGTLYWQLNDCWPAVSWSSMDFNGQWRALHYAVRDGYAPLTIFPQVDDHNSVVKLINDGPESKKVSIFYLNETGETLMTYNDLDIGPREIQSHAIPRELLANANWIELVLEEGQSKQSKIVINPDIKLVPITSENLKMELITEEGECYLQLESTELVQSLYLHSNKAINLSNNFFDLIPGRPYTVSLTSLDGQMLEIGDIGYICLNNLSD